MKKVLFIIDPLDPGLSIEHQLYLIHHHLASDTEIYVKSLDNHPLFSRQLNKEIYRLASINHVISSLRKDSCYPKNWRFTLQPRPVPWHIRKAYYNFPSLVRLYWTHISKEVTKSHTFYDEGISLSSGIPAYYLRDKVQAEKKSYYFPVRQFKQAVTPVIDDLRKQDTIYTASQSMYSELEINNYQVKYYADPYYKESLYRVLLLDEAKSYQLQHLSILSANNLPNRRNIEEFIRMSEYLVKQNIPFRWYFYGDNQNEAMLRSYIKSHHLEKNVVFTGEIANVFRYLEKADVYVEWNKQSSIYFEAETMQKPIVHLKNHNQILSNRWYRIAQTLKTIEKNKNI